MIVPQYWAEARLQRRAHDKQVTVRRFGWSDESPADAQRQAEHRAEAAMARILAGESLPRRERKVAYNGAEGVPIREEVVARHGETVITRNSYGARCLNTPNVLFADVDFAEEPAPAFFFPVIGVLMIVAAVLGKMLGGWGTAVIFLFVALLGGYSVAKALFAITRRAAGGPEQVARARLARFMQAHPDWRVRLYRTPSGLRTLVMHRTFDPQEPAVTEFFQALHTDRMYVRMCQKQHCFRARLSAKPWRIGIEAHLKPRPGVWPVDPERLPERERWVRDYERRAAGYAACRFIETLGRGAVDRDADEVRRLHDELSRAESDLPTA